MYTANEMDVDALDHRYVISILDPYGDPICSLSVNGNLHEHVAKELLDEQAAGLLSHLNK